MPESPDAPMVARLRAAGCVFAEEEARILRERAGADDALLERLLRRRIAGEPLEPLVGWVDFGALRLVVGPGVFVPRQRTLELAAHAVAEVRACQERAPRPVFVEAFAGVAPVASLVRSTAPRARILAAEADAAARTFAAQNLHASGSDSPGEAIAPGEVFAADVLDGLPGELRGGVDVIAAVPPYVPSAELGLMPREAREHEPTAALTGGEDGLHWIRALIEQSSAWLRPEGCLLIELHRTQYAAAVHEAAGVGLTADADPAGDRPAEAASASADAGGSAHPPRRVPGALRHTRVLTLRAPRTAAREARSEAGRGDAATRSG